MTSTFGTILAPCFYNFKSATLANGKTWMVPKVGKTEAVWFLASNWKNIPLANSTMKKPDLPPHKPETRWENWWLPTTPQLHFFALHSLRFRTNLDERSW